jgi:predicted O-linked N-acetylglucosamine transferase (SPINDLY family)
MGEMVAGGVKEYVALSVRLGKDLAFRDAMKRKMGEAMKRGPSFLDGKDYARKIEGAIVTAFNAQMGE